MNRSSDCWYHASWEADEHNVWWVWCHDHHSYEIFLLKEILHPSYSCCLLYGNKMIQNSPLCCKIVVIWSCEGHICASGWATFDSARVSLAILCLVFVADTKWFVSLDRFACAVDSSGHHHTYSLNSEAASLNAKFVQCKLCTLCETVQEQQCARVSWLCHPPPPSKALEVDPLTTAVIPATRFACSPEWPPKHAVWMTLCCPSWTLVLHATLLHTPWGPCHGPANPPASCSGFQNERVSPFHHIVSFTKYQVWDLLNFPISTSTCDGIVSGVWPDNSIHSNSLRKQKRALSWNTMTNVSLRYSEELHGCADVWRPVWGLMLVVYYGHWWHYEYSRPVWKIIGFTTATSDQYMWRGQRWLGDSPLSHARLKPPYRKCLGDVGLNSRCQVAKSQLLETWFVLLHLM